MRHTTAVDSIQLLPAAAPQICSDNREEERIHSDTINTIASLRKIAKEETSKRATEDAEILASISRSMEKLQQQILVNFGAVDEDDY